MITKIIINCPNCRIENNFLIPKGETKICCNSCKELLFKSKTYSGFIYILSNPKMEGLFKIGFTTKTPQERAKELSSETGIPAPFKVEASFLSEDLGKEEKKIHHKLHQYRSTSNREFFEANFRKAVEVCLSVCGEDSQISEQRITKLEGDPFKGTLFDTKFTTPKDAIEKKNVMGLDFRNSTPSLFGELDPQKKLPLFEKDKKKEEK